MKINKTKSPLAGSAVDAPDEKDIAKAVKGEKFAETLAALETASAETTAPSAARTALTAIAAQYDLSDENAQQQALLESAEFLVKSRLSEKYKQADKTIGDLREFVVADPFLKAKLLSVLQKLSGA
ncbi:MAG TPA: hypothetical protein VGC76_18365 [Pyrinomonadaceae bacterium]|jgi:hypothetical protein